VQDNECGDAQVASLRHCRSLLRSACFGFDAGPGGKVGDKGGDAALGLSSQGASVGIDKSVERTPSLFGHAYLNWSPSSHAYLKLMIRCRLHLG
jgi:hypothetical protein